MQLQKSQKSEINQTVLYVPKKRIDHSAKGKKKPQLKTIKGTQKLHMVEYLGTFKWNCSDLSCGCIICLGLQEVPCLYGQYRNESSFTAPIQGNCESVAECILTIMHICTYKFKLFFIMYNLASLCLLVCIHICFVYVVLEPLSP